MLKCVYHENMRLLLQALQGSCQLPDNISQFTELMVCNTVSKSCMSQECPECKNRIIQYKPIDGESSVKYFQWQKGVSYEKVQMNNTISEVFSELQRQLSKFLLHVYVKRVQSSHKELLESRVDGENVLLQVDFSENASLGHQDEIQAVHWTHSQVTVFTSHVWIAKNSIVIISDYLQHTKLSVYAFMNKIFSILKEKYPSIKKINVFSDGASSQFKQRFLFSNLHKWEIDFDVDLKWHFFATSYGKGVVDGLGGTLKRSVWRHVRSGRGEASTPEDFYKVAVARNPNIKVEYISKECIEKDEDVMKNYWDGILPIPNTHKVHAVMPFGSLRVLVADTSDDNFVLYNIQEISDEDMASSSSSDEEGITVAKEPIQNDKKQCENIQNPWLEKYYMQCITVYTDPFTFYVGRALKVDCSCTAYPYVHLQMKFLKQDLITRKFNWPRGSDLECIPRQFVFEGPVTLVGSGPFTVENLDEIQKKFEDIKKSQ